MEEIAKKLKGFDMIKKPNYEKHILLENDKKEFLEAYDEPIYFRISCKNFEWPLKIKCITHDGETNLFISFDYYKPGKENNILAVTNKKEHLYKFEKPKNKNILNCFICVQKISDTASAKFEIKHWFTDPEIEKWRAEKK
jgi:hypothetical protein